MIGLTEDPKTGQDILNFANGSTTPFPDKPGFYISSSACGSGKSTLIAELAKNKKYHNEGVLVVVSTKKAADELAAKIPFSFVLHTDNPNIDKYRENPRCLKTYHVLIITSARAIIDPVELFLDFQWRGKRKYVFIDELITFFPEPFEVPDKVKDAITYIDSTKAHKTGKCVGSERIGKKTYYRHTYGDINKMRAAYRFSKKVIFKGRSKLNEYKEDRIFEHTIRHGFEPINQNIIGEAVVNGSTVVLFDGTSDIVFPDSKHLLPLSGTRYSSDIEFITFKMPIKRKNKEGFELADIEKYATDFINMVVGMTQSAEKVLVVTWKTIEVFKSKGEADEFERITASDNFPEKLKEILVKNGAIDTNLEVIYRGSGLDRGSNEYQDFSTVIFLGEWNVPDNVTSNISQMFSEKMDFEDYKMSLLVQTISRLRIRQHNGQPIKVYFSSDCNYNLFYQVQEYFKANSPSTCKIGGLCEPCKKYGKLQKGFIFDLSCLYSYDSGLCDAIKKNQPYTITITLSDLFKYVPKEGSDGYPRKDRYDGFVRYLKSRRVTLTIT